MKSFLDIAISFEPFMDSDGDIYIHVPGEGHEWIDQLLLDTPIGQSLLKEMLCPFIKRGFPTNQETRIARDIIQGYAFRQPRQEPRYAGNSIIAHNPLARAVMSIARSGATTKDVPGLLSHLNRVALDESIDTTNGKWPHSPDAVGKQLSKLVEVLKPKGVKLTRNEKDRPRTWTIELCQGPSDGCAGQVTGVTPDVPSTQANSDTSPPSNTSTENLADDLTDKTIQDLFNGDGCHKLLFFFRLTYTLWERGPLILLGWILVEFLEDHLNGLVKLRIFSSNDIHWQLINIYVGRNAYVFDTITFFGCPESQVGSSDGTTVNKGWETQDAD